MYLRTYRDQLQQIRQTSQSAGTSEKSEQSGTAAAQVKPLDQQIEELMRSLPPVQRDRPWLMEELVLRLQGRYRTHPHAKDVGTALRRLGWDRVRDWTQAGCGRRFWIAKPTQNTLLYNS